MNTLPEGFEKKVKKRNRILKLSPKTHKITHESGRSTKALWSRIIAKSKKG